MEFIFLFVRLQSNRNCTIDRFFGVLYLFIILYILENSEIPLVRFLKPQGHPQTETERLGYADAVRITSSLDLDGEYLPSPFYCVFCTSRDQLFQFGWKI